ncbi:hypothetical protein [Pedobacter sp. SYSU D00535]|uniref:hypothetical protein n=1 Tax=Pedobacter sp. SYSU D00535 TaxID=2810308 RepID=UPI001A961E43|nr:hypothetical protein [Pedobacter sp. SYSU D00535]
MKRGLSLFLFLLLSILAQAQIVRIDTVYRPSKAKRLTISTQPLYSYTIGLKAFSLEEFPKILNQTNPEEFRKRYFNGLILKYNDNQVSYRISGNYSFFDTSFDNECAGCQEATGKVEDNNLRVGFERNFVYGLVQPYFGTDIGYRRNTFKGQVTSKDPANFESYEVRSLKNGFAFAPLLGIKFNVINHFTLAAETSFSFLYSYEKQNRTTSGADRSPSFNDYRKWEFLFRPVNMLSLQYNFGLNY